MNITSKQASLLREWSAVVPLGMSLAGLAMVVFFAAFVPRKAAGDEGAPARIFQLLMTAQLPIVVYFAIKWLPKRTRAALLVLVLQAAAWLAAVGAILIVEGAVR